MTPKEATVNGATKSPKHKPNLRKKRLGRLLIVLIAALWLAINIGIQAAGKIAPIDGESWQVTRVISGQTIEAIDVNDPDELLQRVRLLGISAPLREQSPWGDRARKRLEELIKEQKVILEFDQQRKDNYDRILAYVWLRDRLINAQLVQEGLVLADPWQPNQRHDDLMSRLQAEARLKGIGIWDPTDPMRQTPEKFRRELNYSVSMP
jgi:micrococcal nuclease